MTIDAYVKEPSILPESRFISRGSFSDSRLRDGGQAGRTKVLIVEENGEMRDHFKQFLGADLDLVVVANPPEAIAMATMYPFQIIIQDIEHEREYEAVALSKQLRKLNFCKDAFFISITGYMLPEGKSIMKRTRFDYQLSKPFTLRQLRYLLHLCIAKETLSILNGIQIDLPSISTTMLVEG